MNNYCELTKHVNLGSIVKRVICILVILSLGESYQVRFYTLTIIWSHWSKTGTNWPLKIFRFLHTFRLCNRGMLNLKINCMHSRTVIKIVQKYKLNRSINCNYNASNISWIIRKFRKCSLFEITKTKRFLINFHSLFICLFETLIMSNSVTYIVLLNNCNYLLK